MLIEKHKTLDPNSVLILNHIPKTGGTSLINLLTEVVGPERSFRHRERTIGTDLHSEGLENLSEEALLKLGFISGHFDYGNHKLFSGKQVYYLGTVRDPVARLISDYFWNRQSGRSDLQAIAQKLTLGEYLAHKKSLASSKMLSSSQILALTGQSELGRAKEIIDSQYLYACTVEQLDICQAATVRLFDSKLQTPRHDNTSTQTPRNPKDLLTDGEINMIHEYCAIDVKLIEWISKRFELAVQSVFE